MFTYYLYQIKFIPEGWEPNAEACTESNDPDYRPGETLRLIVLKVPTGADPEARLRHLASVCEEKSTQVQQLGIIDPRREPLFFLFVTMNMGPQEGILDVIGDVT